MTITVKLKTQPKIITKVDIGEPTVPARITAGVISTRLDQLTDVNAASEVDGGTLVYNANTDTYNVEKLDFNDIDGPIDAGTF